MWLASVHLWAASFTPPHGHFLYSSLTVLFSAQTACLEALRTSTTFIFSPRAQFFSPQIRKTWKPWELSQTPSSTVNGTDPLKTDKYFYLCRFQMEIRTSEEKLKSTSLTKEKTTLNHCLPAEASCCLSSLTRGPQAWVSTVLLFLSPERLAPSWHPTHHCHLSCFHLLYLLKIHSCISYTCFPQRKGYWSFINGDQIDH